MCIRDSIWDVGNIKGDTQFGVDDDDKDGEAAPAAAAAAAAAASSNHPGPPAGAGRKSTKQARTPRDQGDGDSAAAAAATAVKPAARSRIVIGDDDDVGNSARQGHLISIGKISQLPPADERLAGQSVAETTTDFASSTGR